MNHTVKLKIGTDGHTFLAHPHAPIGDYMPNIIIVAVDEVPIDTPDLTVKEAYDRHAVHHTGVQDDRFVANWRIPWDEINVPGCRLIRTCG